MFIINIFFSHLDFQVKDICNELDVRSLCHKILQNVSTLLRADRCSLFLVQGDRCVAPSCGTAKNTKSTSIINMGISETGIKEKPYGTINNVDRIHPVGCLKMEKSIGDSTIEHYTSTGPPVQISSPSSGSVVVGSPVGSTNIGSIDLPFRETFSTSSTHLETPSSASHGCHSKCLVSKLFDVCSQSTLQEMEKKEEIRIPWGTGIVGYVAESGEPVNIPDAYKVRMTFSTTPFHFHCNSIGSLLAYFLREM